MNSNFFDVIIIGAGPIGLACGIEAEKHGFTYLIIEKGCLVNSIFHYPANMTFFSTSERLEIGDVPFISHGSKPTRKEALEYYRRVKGSWKLKVHTYEKVLSISGGAGKFSVSTDKSTYSCRDVIISTGFFDYPNMLGIQGEVLPKVKHYYDDPHPYADQRIIIVGGGNSAVVAALETYRQGAEVTMIIQKDILESNIKYWVLPDIQNRISEGAVKAYFNSHVLNIKEDTVDIETPAGTITIPNDFVLAMTGYRPDLGFLKSSGISLINNGSMEPVYNPETFETNIKGVYLAGVVCGGLNTGKWFIENSRYHAVNIFSHLNSLKS